MKRHADIVEPKPTAAALGATMAGALRCFVEGMGRLPTDAESVMLWAAVQRHHGVPEHHIEPASQRRIIH